MKLSNKYLWILAIVLSGVVYLISCTREDQVIESTVKYTRGNDVLLPKAASGGDTTKFRVDKVHSSCLWQSNYQGAAGLLTGRFNQFGIADVLPSQMIHYNTTGQPLVDSSWAFYENEPSKTFFNGYVQINTSNTGEPGRDTGCNIGALGTDKIIPGVQNLSDSNIARIKTTRVEFDPASNGYIVTAELTWRGVPTDAETRPVPLITKTIIGKLQYIKKSKVVTNQTTGAYYNVFGLKYTFQFNCRDFKVTSTSIADIVEIECNMNFNNK